MKKDRTYKIYQDGVVTQCYSSEDVIHHYDVSFVTKASKNVAVQVPIVWWNAPASLYLFDWAYNSYKALICHWC